MARRAGTASFSEQIAAFAQRVERRAEAFAQAYTLEILEEILRLTPVGDPKTWKIPPAPGYVPGHFKKNWQVTIGAPASGTVAGEDPEGGSVLSSAATTLSTYRLGSPIHITNNLDYARRLEYGWSSQAPEGMVRVTLAQARTLAQRAAAKVRGTQT